MPTEHEYKFVLDLKLAEVITEEELRKRSCNIQTIKQGYLSYSKGTTLRIRSSTNELGKEKWFLTFKQKIGDRVIEIEKKLDARDGNDLWTVCVGKLKKERYVFVDKKNYVWELDMFRYGSHLYFIQLEIELSEGAARPKSIPDFLKKHLLYEVPLTDDRFSNKRLSDVEYASNLYTKIHEGTINEPEEE